MIDRRLELCGIDLHLLGELLDGIGRQLLLPVDTLFSEPAARVDGAAEKQLRSGGRPRTTLPDGRWRVYGEAGAFLALCRTEDGQLVSIKNFFEV